MSEHKEFRIEKDSLGEVRVPVDAYYGAQTQRAVENFQISGTRFSRPFIRALGMIKLAAAEANHTLELLDGRKYDAITKSARHVIDGDLDGEFVLDIYQTGSGTSTNMNANEVIATHASRLLGAAAGERLIHPNDDVNMSQSSNDVIPSAMHIAARMTVEELLLPALVALRDSLSGKAAEFDDVLKSGRTHLMDATPVRLGQEFGGYAAQVGNAVGRIQQAAADVEALALGGTAVGTGINRHRDFPRLAIEAIAKLTGLPFREAENHFEAQAAKDALVQLSGALNTTAVGLMKIANDIRHLSSGPSSGLSEIRLPAVQPGSSIMPGKVNPVLAEALMMACARVMGNHTTITIAGQHGNFELNVMMPVMAAAVLESIEVLAGACNAFRKLCVDGIEADRERCRELLELNPSIATALNPLIGYDKASQIAKESARSKQSVRVVARAAGISEADLDAFLDVRDMTEPGIPGSGQ